MPYGANPRQRWRHRRSLPPSAEGAVVRTVASTKTGWGRPPTGGRELSTARLGGIVEHNVGT